MKKKILSALLCVAMVASLVVGCGSSSEPATEEAATTEEVTEEAAEDITLEVWFSDVLGTEKDLPEEEWLINRYARQFEEENPGVTINVVYQADQGAAQNKLKASVAAGTAPDIVNMFGGYTVTYYKDILADITEYIPAEDMENITGWEGVSENLEIGAPIYGYPEAGNELGIFLYNKSLAAQCGVEFEGENAPKNAEEFKAALHKIKDAGILPIYAGDGGCNTLFTFATGSWWTQMSGSSSVVSDSMATTKFVEDQGFVDTLNFVASFYEEGLVNEDYSSCSDAKERFYNGESVLYPTGNWEIPTSLEVLGDDLGIFCVPSFDGEVEQVNFGGVGQAWTVLNTCENVEMAAKFLSYISQKDYVIAQSQDSGKSPQRIDVTAADLGWEGSEVHEKMLDYCKNVVIWNDNAMQSDVAGEYYKISGMVIYGQMTAEQCAEQLDAVAESVAE